MVIIYKPDVKFSPYFSLEGEIFQVAVQREDSPAAILHYYCFLRLGSPSAIPPLFLICCLLGEIGNHL